MKKIYLFTTIVLAAAVYACSSSDKKLTADERDAIMKADIDFCKYSVTNGFFNAFLKYGDKDIVKLGEGHHPIIGLENLRKAYDGKSGTKELIWNPEFAEVAESGELGYTWGKWSLAGKDTVYYGNYFTVWKKQKDGSWKVKLDGGNSTPPPN